MHTAGLNFGGEFQAMGKFGHLFCLSVFFLSLFFSLIFFVYLTSYLSIFVFLSKCVYLLCISTSEQVLRTPFAGQNQFLFNAKTTFCIIFLIFLHYFILKNKIFCMILSGFLLFFCLFCSVSDGKSCFSVRKFISTSEQCAEHPFAGQNTQHPL